MRKLSFLVFSTMALMLFCCGNQPERKIDGGNGSYNPPEHYLSYENEWKKVEKVEQEGKPRSALEIVEKIYESAKKDNNAPQLVKAVSYKTKYAMAVGEKDFPKVIKDFENETTKAGFPANAIMKSMLAEIYRNYFNQNRYRFYQRTTVTEGETDDIATWSLRTISDRISKLYLESISEKTDLEKIKIGLFDEIIVKGTKPRILRPDLYDFLAHRAFDYFADPETQLTEPADVFEIDSPEFFKPAADFIKIETDGKKAESASLIAFRLIKELTLAHINDKTPEALIDIELKRLDFIRDKSILENTDQLYFDALEKLEKNYSGNSMVSMILYKKALWYTDTANSHQQTGNIEENPLKWNFKTSNLICKRVISEYGTTEAANLCKALVSRLSEKNLRLTNETSNTPEHPFRMLVSYRNVKTLYLKIAAFTAEERKKFLNYSMDMSTGAKTLAEKEAVASWTVDLPDDGDLKDHSVEIKIPALKNGIYGIIAGTDKDFSVKNEALAFSFTDITNLSLITKNEEFSTKFFIADRESGTPVEKAKITIYKTKYDNSKSRYEDIKVDELKTNENGMAVYKKGRFDNSYYERFSAVVQKNEDTLAVNFSSGYNRESKSYERTVFFTDRAIYRPGQTVYFKGIMLKIDKNRKPEILTGKRSTVTFFDVNRQKIASLDLKTNDFGSFHGSFVTPSGILNGNMTIRNSSGAVSVSVEEYKRPKFETNFLPIKESFRLNDTVKVKGTAISYSGAPLTEASVSWRVVRTIYFPYRYWGYDYGYYSGSNAVMGKGTVNTDKTGEYEITFKALPDLSIPEKILPSFTYTVYADVTDINGETHSTSTFINVGYTALSLSTDIPEEINSSEWKKLNVITSNLNGEFEPAKGSVKIYKLSEPLRLLRKRLWEKPDRFLIDENDYVSLFPHDIYKNEDDRGTWKNELSVFSSEFDTAKNKTLELDKVSQWRDGNYVIEMDSADKYGTSVKYRKLFKVYAPTDGKLDKSTFSEITVVTPSVEPGNSAKILIGSKAENVNTVLEIERKNGKPQIFFIKFNSEKKLFSIPVHESDRGNIGYSVMFQKNGRAYHQSGIINVPWTNKQLKTEFLSFRDKLYPGQKEEWRIKITGSKAAVESAEMVATLYDKSLDSFRTNYWESAFFPGYYFDNNWLENQSHGMTFSLLYQKEWNNFVSTANLTYDQLNWFGNYSGYGHRWGGGRYGRAAGFGKGNLLKSSVQTASIAEDAEERTVSENAISDAPSKAKAMGIGGLAEKDGASTKNTDKNEVATGETIQNTQISAVQIRKNMEETAFFYPVLRTNEKGEIIVSFTVPEALTKWKFMGFAHTKDLKTGIISKETVTQKDLMIMPNMPRFLRENDSVVISAKITSMVDKVLTGKAELKLFDAVTMKPVDKILSNNTPFQNFEIKEKGNAVVNWPVKIPLGVSAVTWRIIATAGNQGDGEEATIPILSNRMLVTESMPLPVKGNEKKEFLFKKLIDSKSSDTIINHKLTLEFTSNPVWYAVQALPYLMEYPYECAEQTFSRFYANSLASHIANSNPNTKKVFDQWKNTDVLLSNLQKNEELKSVLLTETPWVLDAQNEEQNKKRVALLFDLNRMGTELDSTLQKLKKMQGYNGGWPWFEGLPESRYITQHIVSGLGKLRNLKVKEADPAFELARKGVIFIDDEMKKSYDWLKKSNIDMNRKLISYMEIHYLYTRSFFTDVPVAKSNLEAYNYWIDQAKKYWLDETPYMNAMEAVALWRLGEKDIPRKIVDSLKERAIYNDELGMYFKENMGGYYWYQFPIETQAVIIEAFQEVTKDVKTVDDLKTWLLKMKQVQNWKTTKATVDAIYALLMGGSDWLKNSKNAEITLGNIKVDPVKMGAKAEAGTGYFKVAWNGSDIKPEMGKVTVVNPNSNPAWGALYWQYFEQLDKITPAQTPLKLEKKIFKEIQGDKGATLEPVLNNSQLKPGDKLKVRIILRSDRDMEYIHMKDYRAAGTEPENVISRYKYQDGLWYYESTKDVSTDFFIERLNKGTYVFEYPLRVNLKGNFSAGITSIQCMYAPEFSAHSEGIRVEVK